MAATAAALQAPPAPPPDEALVRAAIERIRGGDDRAFAVILHAYGPLVAQALARRVPAQEVQEVAQDVFVRAYRSLANYRGDAPFRSWLLSIARAAATDHWRKTYRRRENLLSDFDEPGLAAVESAAQARVAEQDADAARADRARALLHAGLCALSPDDRAVITLVELEDASMEDAARELGCSISAVKVRAFRARHRLKNAIQKLMQNPEALP